MSRTYATRRLRERMTRGLTVSGLDERLPSMTFEEVLEQVRPVLGRYSGWIVPGFDAEDILQELSLVTWNCYVGYDGQSASFVNYLMAACNRKMADLQRYSQRHVQPVSRLRCRGCGRTQAPRGRGGRCRCGGTKWEAETSEHNLASLEILLEEERLGDAATESVEFEGWRAALSPDERTLVDRALLGERLNQRERRRLRDLVGHGPTGAAA